MAWLLALPALWLLAAVFLDRWGHRPLRGGPFDAIVVAGCPARPDGRPSPALERRIRLAVRLWEAGTAPLLAISGGAVKNPVVEAEVGGALARALGVPEEALVVEREARTTLENARLCRDLLGDRRILVVTDTFHVFRCERTFRRFFRHVRGVGTRPPLRTRIQWTLREVAVLALYMAGGQLR